jgi:hypothetical protein
MGLTAADGVTFIRYMESGILALMAYLFLTDISVGQNRIARFATSSEPCPCAAFSEVQRGVECQVQAAEQIDQGTRSPREQAEAGWLLEHLQERVCHARRGGMGFVTRFLFRARAQGADARVRVSTLDGPLHRPCSCIDRHREFSWRR